MTKGEKASSRGGQAAGNDRRRKSFLQRRTGCWEL